MLHLVYLLHIIVWHLAVLSHVLNLDDWTTLILMLLIMVHLPWSYSSSSCPCSWSHSSLCCPCSYHLHHYAAHAHIILLFIMMPMISYIMLPILISSCIIMQPMLISSCYLLWCPLSHTSCCLPSETDAFAVSAVLGSSSFSGSSNSSGISDFFGFSGISGFSGSFGFSGNSDSSGSFGFYAFSAFSDFFLGSLLLLKPKDK